MGFKWKSQKAKGLLPAVLVELGSSTSVLWALLDLAYQGVAGDAPCIQLTSLAPRGKMLSRKYCVWPLPALGTASLHLAEPLLSILMDLGSHWPQSDWLTVQNSLIWDV